MKLFCCVKTSNISFADNKTKLYTTMTIRNVTLDDDSLYGALGSYECHAFAEGDVNERARHGFSVSVIRSKLCTLFKIKMSLSHVRVLCDDF